MDLSAQYATIRDEIDAAIRRTVERGDFILGAPVKELEAAFASYCGVAHAVGVGSGTDALFFALRALGLGPQDEVIVPSMTFVATAEPVVYCGARPVFVDVSREDLLIDANQVEAAITPRTRGILPVHLYGTAADMDVLGDIARRHGLWVLEDAAQAHGAMWHGRRTGSFGQAACFSFYPGKNLGAYGDGGMVVTDDAELADRLRLMRDHGARFKYEHTMVGYCSRLDTLQAAILNVKLAHLDDWNAARSVAAANYDALIGNRLERIGSSRRSGSVHHIYAVRIPHDRRDHVRDALQHRGIGVGVHYPAPVHRQPAFIDLGFGDASLPVATSASLELLSLPLYPEITEAQQRYVVQELFAAIGQA
ncbi:MAG: DegT/DnrJ/EryC1/StrS family aminotransferase [Chloroflexota bacterium]|nr:DegT/DnrJ/EryC1/StrS family aminotransferase [Chloroflexota bacterium]